jgi:hypothetical protein
MEVPCNGGIRYILRWAKALQEMRKGPVWVAGRSLGFSSEWVLLMNANRPNDLPSLSTY